MRGARTKKTKRPASAPAATKKFGRPTKLTPEVQEKIVSSIKAGNYVEVAAAYAGISKTTYYGWIRKGEARAAEIERAEQEAEEYGTEPIVIDDPEGDLYYNFLNAVEQASAESEVRDMTLIGLAAARNWRAAAWRLEHKYPSRYGRQVLEVSGADGVPLVPAVGQVVILELPDNGRDKT